MTSIQAIEIFQIILDKKGSPYLTDDEVLSFLNMAQYERLNRLLPDDMGGVVNFEFDQNTFENIKPFVFTVSPLNTTGGVLTNTTINTALQSASGDGTTSYFRILNVIQDDELPVKYVKHNNIGAYLQNFFKAPSVTSPKYTETANSLKLYPANDAADLSLTLLKRPKTLTLAVNPEFDDYNMNLVIVIALQLAGVSVRDEELSQLVKNTNISQ